MIIEHVRDNWPLNLGFGLWCASLDIESSPIGRRLWDLGVKMAHDQMRHRARS